MESNHCGQQTSHVDNNSCISDDDVSPLEKPQPPIALAEPQTLFYAMMKRKKGLFMVPLKQLLYQKKHFENLPRLGRTTKSDQLLQIRQDQRAHFCRVHRQTRGLTSVLDNDKKIFEEQKTLVPNKTVTLARQYVSAKLTFESLTLKTNTQLQTELKNL